MNTHEHTHTHTHTARNCARVSVYAPQSSNRWRRSKTSKRRSGRGGWCDKETGKDRERGRGGEGEKEGGRELIEEGRGGAGRGDHRERERERERLIYIDLSTCPMCSVDVICLRVCARATALVARF